MVSMEFLQSVLLALWFAAAAVLSTSPSFSTFVNASLSKDLSSDAAYDAIYNTILELWNMNTISQLCVFGIVALAVFMFSETCRHSFKLQRRILDTIYNITHGAESTASNLSKLTMYIKDNFTRLHSSITHMEVITQHLHDSVKVILANNASRTEQPCPLQSLVSNQNTMLLKQ